MKIISKLHHITQSNFEGANPLQQIEEVCKGGGKCSQLRLKNISIQEYKSIALEARKITNNYHAQLIINDNIEVAKYCSADGIHLGKDDATTKEARKQLGDNIIIGRTCNTFEDITHYTQEDIDYVGVGPFRFTDTKEKLSPTLGIEGYKEIITKCSAQNINTPIIAIGGIQLDDIDAILSTGIFGLALAGLLNKTKSQSEVTRHALTILTNN